MASCCSSTTFSSPSARSIPCLCCSKASSNSLFAFMHTRRKTLPSQGASLDCGREIPSLGLSWVCSAQTCCMERRRLLCFRELFCSSLVITILKWQSCLFTGPKKNEIFCGAGGAEAVKQGKPGTITTGSSRNISIPQLPPSLVHLNQGKKKVRR